MARHQLAAEAEAELDEIWFYVASQSGDYEVADHIIDQITERFWLLAQRPHIGRQRDDLRPGLRSIPVGDYVIIYRLQGMRVYILHVLHGSRDIPKLIHFATDRFQLQQNCLSYLKIVLV